MSNDSQTSERTAQFRRALVATVDLRPFVRRRPSLRLAIGAVAAFAVVGALTGGAVATASRVDPDVATAQAIASSQGREFVSGSGGTLVGHPQFRSARGPEVIDVGIRPAGATTLVEGFGCLDVGHLNVFLDSKKVDSFDDCSAGGGGASNYTVTGNDGHQFRIQTQKSVRFAVWLSWARIPRFTDSSAQRQELVDGVVSREEVLAAFNRFAGCMAALGHPLLRPTTGLVPGFSEEPKALIDGSDHRCYLTEYADVDAKWQTEVSNGTAGIASSSTCPSPDPTIPSPTPSRLIMAKGAVLPDLTGCPWIG